MAQYTVCRAFYIDPKKREGITRVSFSHHKFDTAKEAYDYIMRADDLFRVYDKYRVNSSWYEVHHVA